MTIWLLCSIPAVALLYFALRPLFRHLARRSAAKQAAAQVVS
jgi:hypothetical protein